MSGSPATLRLGACRVTLNGVDLGWTRDGISLGLKTTTKKTEIDHFGAVEIRERVTTRALTIKTSLLAVQLNTLISVFYNAGIAVAGNTAGVSSGYGLVLSQGGVSMSLHPVDKPDNDISEDIFVPVVTTSGNLDYTFKGDTERAFGVEFLGYPDSTNILFYFGRNS